MKKIILVLATCLLLVGCNNEKNNNKNNNEDRIDTSLVDLTVKHQEAVDELNDEIASLEEKIEGMSAESGNDLTTALEKLELAEETLATKENEIVEKNEAIDALNLELSNYANSDEGSPAMMPNWNLSILNGNSDSFNYILEDLDEPYAQRTYVLGEGQFLDLMRDQGVRANVHLGEGYEVSAFEIYGTVYNVTWAEIIWSDDYSSYEIGEVIENIAEVTDTTVYVHALLAETLPHQVVYFENSDGVRISQTLSYDGYGVSGNLFTFDE